MHPEGFRNLSQDTLRAERHLRSLSGIPRWTKTRWRAWQVVALIGVSAAFYFIMTR